jgi:glycyl-tRNA synthetase beta chain
MAGRPEGVGSAGATRFGLSKKEKVGAPRATTPSVAFGDISPSRGEIFP